MTGPPQYLVDRVSATSGRPWERDLNSVTGLKKDHSGLVRFSMRNVYYDQVLKHLEDLVKKCEAVIQTRVAPIGHEARYDRNIEQRLEVMQNQIAPASSITHQAR